MTEVKFTATETVRLCKKFKKECMDLARQSLKLTNDEMIQHMIKLFTKEEITSIAFGFDMINDKLLLEKFTARLKSENDISFQ